MDREKELLLRLRRQEERTGDTGKEVIEVLGSLPLTLSCCRVVPSTCTSHTTMKRERLEDRVKAKEEDKIQEGNQW